MNLYTVVGRKSVPVPNPVPVQNQKPGKPGRKRGGKKKGSDIEESSEDSDCFIAEEDSFMKEEDSSEDSEYNYDMLSRRVKAAASKYGKVG